MANRDVLIKLNSGYERTIRKDSVWRQVGTLPQGKVYRPEGGAFTVEGAHVHEAYLVVSSGKLVGFYLPVEKAYSALDTNPA